ncbi:DUF6542 domain-containing protein [Streptomyces sp. NPDC051173]|uniref:DUF6542 domain-containing protein n=1 Tax=Streptomyces sp. NPDC051173 TaxID=3155164 RepID=UPI00344C2CD0
MAARRTETLGEAAGRQGARSRTATRASARVPGPRPGRGPARAARAGAARPLLLGAGALLVAGAVADEARGTGLGWVFTLAAALAAALATVACSRAQTWWAFALPPWAIAVVGLTAQLLADSSATGGNAATSMTTALHWAIDTFPAMAAAETSALAVLIFRTVRSRRHRRAVHA